MVRAVAFLLFLFVVPLSATALVPTDHPNEKQAVAAVFGIIENSADGKPAFVRTNIVPLVENQQYGWAIGLPRNVTTVRWKEEFTLPAPPETWGEGENGVHAISRDRKVSIKEADVLVRDGIVSNFWSVAPGDPVGEYVIRIFINDSLVATFHFEAVRPAAGKPIPSNR